MPTLQSAIDGATNGVAILDPTQVYTLTTGESAKITETGFRLIGRGARVVKDTLQYPSLVVFADGVRVEGVRFEGPAPPNLLQPMPQSFTGTTLPAIGLALPFSTNRYDCAWAQVVVAADNCRIERCRFTGATGVHLLPHRDGRRGRNNTLRWNRFYDYNFGLIAYAQDRLTVLRTYGEGPLQPTTSYGPLAVTDGLAPGHLIYLAPGTGPAAAISTEECWMDDVLINHVIERVGSAAPISTLYTTIKSNNAHGLRIGNVQSVGIPSCLDFLGCDGFAWNINQSGGYMSDDPTQWATFRWAIVKVNGALSPTQRNSGTMTIENATFAPDGEGVRLYRSERPGLTLRNVSFPTAGDQDPPFILPDSAPVIE
jgi:hypothetical protein